MLRRLVPLALALAVLVLATSNASAGCWTEIDPGAFAGECPVVIRGRIVSVTEAPKGGERLDDLARIKVTEVRRAELKDVPIKEGDLFTVHMISKNNRLRTSTDLNYPIGTEALWLVKLTAKGEFRIDVHPVQKQPVDAKLRFELRDIRVGTKGEEGTGTKTKQWWIAMERDRIERAQRDRAKHEAVQKEIRDIAGELAAADNLETVLARRFKQAEPDVRRSVLQLRGREQPLEGDRLVDVVEWTLRHEPDENIRSHAADALAYTDKPGKRAGAVLAEALKDKSRSVRLFACQALKFRKATEQAERIAPLLKDADAEVRDMARETLQAFVRLR
ncbi:MAG: HEAT repeat domain-containing protein [Gemmataceae bacterium]